MSAAAVTTAETASQTWKAAWTLHDTAAVSQSLCRCLSGDPGTARAELRALSDDEWAELVRQSIRHGLAAILHRLVATIHSEGTVPSTARRSLEDLYLLSALKSRSAFEQLAVVLSAFEMQRIPTIVLKGAYLASHVYSDPAERSFEDLDLLVPPDDLERAHLTLSELGYAAIPSVGVDYGPLHHHFPPLAKKALLPIELHRRLTRKRPLDEAVWSRARSIRVAGGEALALSKEDLVIHLCLHAASHKLEIPLRMMLDLHRVLGGSPRGIDWDRLVRLAQESDAGPFVFVGLSLAQATLGTDVPSDALDALQQDETDHEVVETALELVMEEGAKPPSTYRDFIRQSGLPGKVGSVRRAMFPDRETLDRLYGKSDSSISIVWRRLIRPLSLLRRAPRWLWQLSKPGSADRTALGREKKRMAVAEWLASRDLARE